MAIECKPSLETNEWASYATFDSVLDTTAVKNMCATYLAHNRAYPAKVELVAPNKVRVSPVEPIDPGEFYVVLEGAKLEKGARISSGTIRFGVGNVGRT